MQSTLAALSAPDVGGTPAGGVSRPALSDADRLVRIRFASLCTELGLTVTIDDVGNMYGRRPGTDPHALPVVIGSHLDTVIPGGRFDGILGVTVALETVALLNAADVRTERPIVVVNWTGEEGARFPPAMIGSGVVSGVWDIGYAHDRVDPDGVRLGAELERIGFLGTRENRLGAFAAALELHIEQGVQLHDAGADVGIVPVIEPVRWCTVTVRGDGGHAGGPGPGGRRDPMVAASRMVVAARDASMVDHDFKTTVGSVDVQPGSTNVIPNVVTFSLDIRSSDDGRLEERLLQVRSLFSGIADEEGVHLDVDLLWSMTSAPFDAAVIAVLARTADKRGVNWIPTIGSIGHDSLHLAAMGPTAMLFTPTPGGRSHCEDEDSPWDSIVAAAGVFADTARTLATDTTITDTTTAEAVDSTVPAGISSSEHRERQHR